MCSRCEVKYSVLSCCDVTRLTRLPLLASILQTSKFMFFKTIKSKILGHNSSLDEAFAYSRYLLETIKTVKFLLVYESRVVHSTAIRCL